jgi:DNA-binding IclR family transcriptional regulator
MPGGSEQSAGCDDETSSSAINGTRSACSARHSHPQSTATISVPPENIAAEPEREFAFTDTCFQSDRKTRDVNRERDALEFRRMPRNPKIKTAPTPGQSAGQSVQVIARAASVLRALEGEQTGLSLAQIAQRVGLARSTVQRIVDALRAEQFLIAATPSSGVRLGPALIRLGASAGVDFDKITRPIMARLSQRLGETVDLSVLKGFSAVFTDQIPGAHRLRAVSGVGDTFPLHCTANGKALLSVMPEQTLRRFLLNPLPRMTPSTIVKSGDLRTAIEACTKFGVAFDLEEHTEGICAVGTAFLDPLGRCMALSIPVPTTRFNKMKGDLVRELLNARASIIETLGPDARY